MIKYVGKEDRLPFESLGDEPAAPTVSAADSNLPPVPQDEIGVPLTDHLWVCLTYAVGPKNTPDNDTWGLIGSITSVPPLGLDMVAMNSGHAIGTDEFMMALRDSVLGANAPEAEERLNQSEGIPCPMRIKGGSATFLNGFVVYPGYPTHPMKYEYAKGTEPEATRH